MQSNHGQTSADKYTKNKMGILNYLFNFKHTYEVALHSLDAQDNNTSLDKPGDIKKRDFQRSLKLYYEISCIHKGKLCSVLFQKCSLISFKPREH